MAGRLRGFWAMMAEAIRLEVRGSLRYRFAVVSDAVLLALLLAFFIVSGTGSSFVAEYGVSDHRPLLLAGYIAWMLASFSLSASVGLVTDELVRGTFYRKINAELPMGVLLASHFVGRLLIELVEVLALLGISWLAWGVGLPASPAVIGSLLLCTLGMYGVGLALAGLSLFFKRIGSMLTLIQIGLLFVTDTLPTAPVLSAITSFLPLTLCNEVMRAAASGADSVASFVLLGCVSLVWLVTGHVAFAKLAALAKQKGVLLFY